MKKIMLVTILVIFVSGLGFAISPSQRITEDCGIYIEANHINQLFSQAESYAKLFGMPIQRGQIKQMLAMNIFNSQTIPGIDLSKKIGTFFLFNKKIVGSKPQIVMMIPVKNWRTYRSRVLTKLRFGNSTLSKRLGNYSVIASSEAGMRRFNESPRLENVKIFREPQLNFFINFNIVGNMIGQVAEKVQGKISPYRNSGQENQMQAQVLDYYKSILKSILNMTTAVKIDNKGFEISYNVKTDTNSELGKIMAKSTNGKLNSLTFLPKNAIAVGAGRSNVKAIANYYENLILSLLDNSPRSGIKIQKEIFQIIFSFIKLHFKDEMALAMLPTYGKELSFITVTKINSPRNALNRYKKLARKFNSSAFLKKAAQEGIKLKVILQQKENNSYDIPIHKLSLKLSISKKIGKKGKTRQFISLLRKILNVRFFHYKDYEIMAFGTKSNSNIKNLIKVAKRRSLNFLKSAAYRNIKRTYGAKSKNGIFYISLPKITKEFLQFANTFSKNKIMTRFLKLLKRIPLQTGGVYGYSSFKNGNNSGKIMISKQEIKNIFKIYMQFLQSMKTPTRHYRVN